MKITLSTSQIANRLRADEYAGWSYAGAMALAKYLDAQDESLGEETEFDLATIRGDWSEYKSAVDAAEVYDYETKDEQDALEFLEANTTIVEFDGGVLVESF